MNAKMKLALTVLTMVMLAATMLPVNAHSMKKAADWSGAVYPLNKNVDPGGALVNFSCPIKGAGGSYENLSTGVAFTVRTRVEGDCEGVHRLEPGHAYTVWLMTFNHPEFCRGGPDETNRLRCSQRDHLNPATGFSVIYGTGGWAEGSDLSLRGFREANPLLDTPPDVALGPGLVNPEGAEIHLRIRDHGNPCEEADDKAACRQANDDRIKSFRGGCTETSALPFFAPREDAPYGDYDCVDIHGTAS